MPTDVMPEQKVKDATLSLRQLVSLIHRRWAADGESGELEAYAAIASVLADVIERGWKETLAKTCSGYDADAIRTSAAALSLAGSAWRELFQEIQDMAEQTIQETGKPIKWLPDLVGEARKVEEARASARRLVDSVNVIFDDSLDQDMLTKSEEDFAAGRFQKDKDIVSRLRSRKSS